MSVSEPFIRRPVGTSLLAIGLLMLGVVAYHFLPVAPVPRVDYPVIQVSAGLPGADPATMATSVAAPLEKRLGQISGVSELTSVSTLGGTSITVQFDLDRDVDGAARDVQAAIVAAASDLPLDLPSLPGYRKVNPADAPILILAMTSDTLEPTKVFECADEIVGQRLNQVEGVSQANVTGAEKSAVRVQINPAALASIGMSLEEVRSLLSQVNVDNPKGSLEGDQLAFMLASNGQLFDAQKYQSLILTEKHGIPVRLDTLGKVVESVENTRLAGWAGTKPAVLIMVFKQPGANVIETVDRVKAVLPQIKKWIPPAIDISVISDRTTTIRASFDDVRYSMMITIALVVMVIFLFLRRFWPTFITSITVPLVIAGTLGFMYLWDYSLDNLSLMAIAISVGFVVDDAIVVIENIFRHIELGEKPFTAALKGARQIGFTVVSMSTSLVAVFIPLLFMKGLVGRLFHEFAVTLSLAIVVSGVISLTLTPMLCSRLLRTTESYGKPGPFYRATESIFNWMRHGYERGLRWALRHEMFMLLLTFATICATLFLFATAPWTPFPQQDTGNMMGSTMAAEDISFTAMARLQKRVAELVLADPAVETMGSFVGGSSVNSGRMFVSLKPLEERKVSVDQVINRLRPKLAQVDGISLILQGAQDIRMGGRMSRAQYQYSLQSPDLDELSHWSTLLVEALRKYPNILTDINTDQQTAGLQAKVVIDRDAMARLNLSLGAIDNTLYDAFGQRQVSTLYKRYNQHHVILEADPRFQLDPASLQYIYVKSSTGRQVPLASVAKLERSNTSLSVSHQGQFPAVTISFNLGPGVALSQADALIQKAKEDLHMPATVQGSAQGTYKVFQDSMSGILLLIAAAFITVYVVLGMLYESLIHPITILLSLPSAGVGALLALRLFGYDLSFISAIGIILLMGIVKKNAIMMVDFAISAEREENLSPAEAIYKACLIRFRPIMMTTMAALLGSLPLALGMGNGSELRRPMGVAVVGGLCLSQVLTLYTTPVIYLFFEQTRGWVRSLIRRPRLAAAPAS